MQIRGYQTNKSSPFATLSTVGFTFKKSAGGVTSSAGKAKVRFALFKVRIALVTRFAKSYAERFALGTLFKKKERQEIANFDKVREER